MQIECHEDQEEMVVDPIEIEPESRATLVGNSVDSRRRVLTAMNIFGDPEVLLVRDFLDEAEIQHLIDVAESGWEPSEVGQGVYRTKYEGQDLANQVSEIRTSYSCLIEPGQSETITAIEHRLAALAGMDVKFLEPLNMVRYLPGQFFSEHHDGRFRPKTIFVYLNDIAPGDGGETMFPELRLKIVPRRGCAVMWSNVLGPQQEDKRMVHQGLPPTTGTKYGVNCFFNDKPMRRFVCEGADSVPASPRINGRGPETLLDPLLLLQHLAERPSGSLADKNPQLMPGGRCFRRLRVSKEPALWVVPDLVSGREACLLMDVVDKQQGRIPPNSPREKGSDGEVEELLADLQERLRAAAGSASQLELLELRRLAPSKQASAGAPVISAPSSPAHAEDFRAVYLFLNDIPDEGGGELHFPQIHTKVRARRGFAVVWNCGRNGGQDHLGLPPQTCARYGAACSFSTSG
mmetsp:Transcript_67524/g.158440  ORF Transcript_67524/g.158440 Transcript_67524/m.158440 type:complete len:462 (+) Transcript_67524:65-1450(+)